MPAPNDGERQDRTLTGIAGVHYVASELSRRGLIALPTTRNIAGYDIVVATTGGGRHANLQVKTSRRRTSFFRMPPSEKVRSGPRDFYVLLRWLGKEGRYEGFLLSGRVARAMVKRAELSQRRKSRDQRKPVVPMIWVGTKAEHRTKKWRHAWQTWKL